MRALRPERPARPARHAQPSRQERLRDLALDLWARVSADWSFASAHSAEVFRGTPDLSPPEKAEVVRTLHEMLRQARRLDFALAESGAPRGGRALDLARFLACQVLADGTPASTRARGADGAGPTRGLEEARRALPKVDWARVAQADARIAAEPDPVQRFGLAHSLPDWLARELRDTYGEEADALARALNARALPTLRVNALLAARADVAEELSRSGLRTRPTRLSPHGLILETPADLYALRAYREGRIEAQDEASQLVAELVAPAPRTLVVDACAGAGGKTLALGALMRNRGVLAAVDRNAGRLEELRRRARRAGLSNHRVLDADLLADPWPRELEALRGKAARVLVDAPCTGLGALRRNPEARWRLAPEDLERLPREQERIARAALAFCKPNGRLIYATCSLLPVENERVVERLLEDTRFRLVPIAQILGGALGAQVADPSGQYLKLLPHRHWTDGFFAAVLRRVAE